jgi:hypothetical protein
MNPSISHKGVLVDTSPLSAIRFVVEKMTSEMGEYYDTRNRPLL